MIKNFHFAAITTIVSFLFFLYFPMFAQNYLSSQNSTEIVFTKSNQTLGNTMTFGLAIADVDLDGDNDIFMANYSDISASRLWLNNGNGSFTIQSQYFGSGAPAPHDVDMADLNGDLYPDIFLVNHNGPSKIYFRNGNGSYTESGQTIGTPGDSPQTIQLVDVDNDGDKDAYIYNISAPNRIWLNDGNGFFTMRNIDYGGSNSDRQVLADFNNDSFPDLFISKRTEPAQIWMNDGAGNFSNTDQALGSGGGAIDCKDVDGDGDTDIVVASYHEITVLFNQNNTGTFIAGMNFGEGSFRCKLFDADLDGDYDLVTTFLENGNKLWLNDGTGRFTFHDTIFHNTRVFSIGCKDIDGDNDIDVVLGQQPNTGGNSLYFNESGIVGVEHKSSQAINYKLHNNYPNPFNPSTKIEYTLEKPSNVCLIIFDITGRNIKTLVDCYKSNGNYNITWNGKDNSKNNVSTGVYFYQLRCNSFSDTKKMILME